MEKEEDLSYLDGLDDDGLDAIDNNALATAYLSMVQPRSTMATDETPVGTWRNSATGNGYGKEVEVVVVQFKTVWTERDKNPPFLTVDRYEPNSIPVDIERPRPGTRGYPKMTNPNTGNEIKELYVYAVIIVDHPEDGVLLFSPTVGSMRACKNWNSMLKSSLLPNGKRSLIGYTWKLKLDIVPNPVRAGDEITKLVNVSRGSIVSADLLLKHVKPAMLSAPDILMLAAPEQTGDSEE